MNVLSLFDGISCGQISFERAGIKVDKYFASEIDKYAIQVTQKNYPNTIQLGDINNYKLWNLPKIDIIIGGSPCQGFSTAGKELNFNDERSKLFFIFVKCLERFKPKYFLLENVYMKQEYQDIISSCLGVIPIFINSRLVSAQDRKRLYWTNIPNIKQPIDKNISIHSIIGNNNYAATMRGRRINDKGVRDDYNMQIPLRQYVECRKDDKCNCITTVCKDNIIVTKKSKRLPIKDCQYRYYTSEEYEQLQTLPIGYTNCVSENQAKKEIGNGWTIDVIVHIFSYLKS